MRASNAGNLGHAKQLYKDTSVPKFLHIPRTGGHARAYALQGAARTGAIALTSHNTRASMVEGPTILFVRHPVDRFLSVVQKRNSTVPQMLALLRQNRRGDGGDELLLRQQAWWNDRPGVWTIRLEDMDRVWNDLLWELTLTPDLVNPLPKVGDPAANSAAARKPVMTRDERHYLQHHYADDFKLWYEAEWR